MEGLRVKASRASRSSFIIVHHYISQGVSQSQSWNPSSMTDIGEVDPLVNENTISQSEQVKEEVNEENKEKKSLYHCDFCDFRTVKYAAFQIHVVRKHNFRPCKFCHFYADSLPNLNFHQETEHCIDPFSRLNGAVSDISNCFVCHVEFQTNYGLKTHFEAEHKGVRFSCEQCNYKSSYRTSLKLHIKVKHEIEKVCNNKLKSELENIPAEDEDDESLEPGEIVRDDEGEILGDSLLKTEVEEQNHCQSDGPTSQPFTLKYPQFLTIQEGEEDKKKAVAPGQAAHQRDENQLLWCQYADCTFRSKYIPNLRRHETSQHRGLRFQCDQCPFTAKQKSEVVTHSKAEHDGIIYSCDCCDFKTSWKSYFKKHQVEKHGASISFKKREVNPARQGKANPVRPGKVEKCPQCDFSSLHYQSVQYHNKKSTAGRLFTCSHCEYRNCLKRSLQKHELKYHAIKQEKNDKCPQCDFSSLHYQSVQYHIKKSTAGKLFTCRHCEYRNCLKRSLQKHELKYHGIKQEKKTNDKCPECDFSSFHYQTMQYHIKKRTAGRLFTCSHCEYRNCLKRSLQKHELKYHAIKQENKTNGKYFELNKKIKGKCPKCDFSSWNDKAYDFHLRQSKKSEEIHLCEHCDYKNCSIKSLKIHKFSKHKVKQYERPAQVLNCSKCGKKYQTLHGLRVHKSICLNLPDEEPLEAKVTGESPLEKTCDKCDFKTSDNDDYYDHVLEHLPSNTSQPQKLTNSVGNDLNPIKDSFPDEAEIPTSTSVIEELLAGKNISSFKDQLTNKLNELSRGESRRPREDEDGECLEPGEIVRDAEGQILGDFKTEDAEQLLPQDSNGPTETETKPGEIVRDTQGEMVRDCSFKPELEELVQSQDLPQDYPQASGSLDSEVESAVGFLISLNQPEQTDSSEDVKEEFGENNLATNADENTDYNFDVQEFKCGFGCGQSFSKEDDLYIHITDQHNF